MVILSALIVRSRYSFHSSPPNPKALVSDWVSPAKSCAYTMVASASFAATRGAQSLLLFLDKLLFFLLHSIISTLMKVLFILYITWEQGRHSRRNRSYADSKAILISHTFERLILISHTFERLILISHTFERILLRDASCGLLISPRTRTIAPPSKMPWSKLKSLGLV